MMNKIEKMTRAELIELIEAAKNGKLKTGIKCFYFLDNQLYQNTQKGLKSVTIEQFINKSNEDDIIISFEDIDYNRHPHLKGKLNIVVPDEKTARNIEKLC